MDGTLVDEILDDHPLAMLLARPHPDLTMSQLLRLTAQYIVTVGEAYWLKVGSMLGVPAELHPMLPQNVTPQYSGGVVTGYNVQSGSGRIERLPSDVVVRFYLPDPQGFWNSEGYLGPSAITADAMKFAEQHLRRHYEHDATPKTALEPQEGAQTFDADQAERFRTLWNQLYSSRSGAAKGAPGIIPTAYKLIQMAAQSGADVTPLLEFWRDELLLSFGVARSVLGQVVSGDRSSAETNAWVFDRQTVKPIADLIADALTLKLAPDFDPSLFVQFEPFVAEDKNHVLAQEQSDLDRKVRSINQTREDRGLDPVPWGEEPVGKIGETPYTGEAFEFAPFTDEVAEDDENGERSHQRSTEYFDPRACWLRQLAQERRWLPVFLRAVRQVFREQESQVVSVLKERRSRIEDPSLLIDEELWRQLFRLHTEPIRERAFLGIMAETLSGFGIEDFTFTDSMRNAIVQDGAKMIKHVNETTRSLVSDAIQAGSDAGEGVDTIAARIRGVMRERRKSHARTIARTETLKASSRATLEGFKVAGVARYRWNTSLDDAVRDSHITAEGQVRAAGVPFELGDGELADGPRLGVGGGLLSAANTINCRCFLTPVRGE